MKVLIISLLLVGCLTRVNAQKKFDYYQTIYEEFELRAGDTIQFLEGSLGGQFVHVFYMVGKVQKRKATFSSGFYTELVIDHFLERKEKGEKKIYAVMGIPNKPKWLVWALLDEALDQKEIKLKSKQ